MSRRLMWVSVGIAVIGCSSSTQSPNAGVGGDGATAGVSGSAGSGGSAGSSGSAGTAGTALVACMGSTVDNGNPGAIANPGDFSVNSDTGAPDQHTLWMGRADMVRRVTQYSTAGSADHKHEVVFTETQLDALLGGMTITVATSGPPSNAATGHSHTITVRACGVSPGFGDASTGAPQM